MRPIGELSYKNARSMYKFTGPRSSRFPQGFRIASNEEDESKKLKMREKVWANTLSRRKPYDIIMKKLKEQENG